ncbi:SMP-30/gluconolactonase/LRE family protein [Gordonia alkanivorans]|uniref:SMP-30/gluconolactonase/LRE family protein n=1 Tax=Gordonia alkanivorans TaxID=84096 RepID=UPI002449B1A2|nr:SMP-30/gluconolactonase/LRE family protein [Gordonia alkanivorans]MDH3052488.1 SMP-30/gluconolactonase/LRE family protein [Gordonia alkanivorans]
MPELEFEVVHRPRGSVLFESLRWNSDAACFQWVDIECSRLYRWNEASGEIASVVLPFRYLPLALPISADVSLVASESCLYRFSWINTTLEHVLSLPVPAGARLNDGNFDAEGNLWIGSMNIAGTGNRGSLYCVSPELVVDVARDGVGISNGCVPHPDGGVLHIDTPTRCINRVVRDEQDFRIEPFAEVEGPGVPDGMAVVPDGVWVAIWGGARIDRFGFDGTRYAPLPVARRYPTSLAVGGTRGGKVAFTSATGDEEGRRDPEAMFSIGEPVLKVGATSAGEIDIRAGVSGARRWESNRGD